MPIFRIFLLGKQEKTPPLKAVFNLFIALAVVLLFFYISLLRIGYRLDFHFLAKFQVWVWHGFIMTLGLSAVSLALSLVLGILSAIGNSSPLLPLRYLCNIYVKFIRGTPLMTQILLFYYIVGTAWGVDNRFLAGVIILSLFEGAYISEIIRGSLISMDSSQLEAARAVGFTRRQTVFHVILPQLVARTLPALTGQFASIVKDSSLLSIIALSELTQTMQEISDYNFKTFECYLLLGLLYLVFTLPISFFTEWLERRFNYEH